MRESRPSAPAQIIWHPTWADYETWLPVPGREHYEVSDFGRVRSPRRLLKPTQNSQGYLKVALGRAHQWYLHRLVLFTFVGPPEDWACVDHYNFNRHDNRLQNLRYLPENENNNRHYRHHLRECEEHEASLA